MAKVCDIDTVEELSNHLNEKWVWKDETNTLELTSCNLVRLSSVNHNKKTSKRLSTPAALNHDKRPLRQPIPVSRGNTSQKLTVTTSNNTKQPTTPIKKFGGKMTKSRVNQHNITMVDIKTVAKNHPLKKDSRNLPMFQDLYNSQQLDDFLWAALNYFDAFFEKKALEEKPKPMAVEPSLAEKKAIALVSSKEDEAKKALAQCYGILVLGLGLTDGHHMHCGRKRSSATQKDREQYETLYNFVSNVTWITFRRPSLEVIEKELGRLLRSETFNPAGRPKMNKEVYAKDRLNTDNIKPTLTPAEYRRLQPKRPAIKSIINQRSPVLTSLLPTSTEAAQQFTNRRESPPFVNIEQQKLSDRQTINKRVGIIGECISGFNAENLLPIDDESTQNEVITSEVNTENSTSMSSYVKEATDIKQDDMSSLKQQLDAITSDNT